MSYYDQKPGNAREPVEATESARLDGVYPKRPRSGNLLLTYLAVAMIGAILGGLFVVVAAPSLYGSTFFGRTIEPPLSLPAPMPAPSQPTVTGLVPPAVYVSERLGPTVVGITNRSVATDWFGRQTPRDSTGSGVIFAQNGYIVTNNHVVEGARELTVMLADGRSFPARLIGTDRPTDIAVIKIDADGLPTAEFGDSDSLRVGDYAIAIGNPVGAAFQRSVTQGIISGLNRVLRVGDQTLQLIQTDAVINPGNSGGPLANAQGQVIGINTLKIDLPRVEGMGFAVPINVVRPIINEIIAKGRVQRPWLGVGLLDKELAAQYNIHIERGLYIAEVSPNGPADRAGIKKGDVMLDIAGKQINNIDELRLALAQHRAGDKVDITISRGNQLMKKTVLLGEMPDTQRR